MRVRGGLLAVAVATAAIAGSSCSGGTSGKALPPDGLTSQQQAASQAVGASAAMHSLLYSVRQLIAIGNTTQSPSFASLTPPPAGTPTPLPTQTSTSVAATDTPVGSPSSSGSSSPSPTGTAAAFAATGSDGTTPTPTPTPPLSNDPTDSNANGIPDHVTLVFVTAAYPAPVGMGATQALFTTSDLSTSVAVVDHYTGGMTVAVDASQGLSFGWQKVSDLFRTTYDVTRSSADYHATSSFADTSSFQTDTAGHGHLCVSQGSWSMVYSPLPATSYQGGSAPTSGTLAISNGTGFVAVDGTTDVLQISMSTTTALTIDAAACGPTLFRAGALQVVFGTNAAADPVADVHWTNCTPTITKAH